MDDKIPSIYRIYHKWFICQPNSRLVRWSRIRRQRKKKKRKTKRSLVIRARSAAWSTRHGIATRACAIARVRARAWYACAWVECRCACTPLGRAGRHIFRGNARNNDCARSSRPYRTTSTASSRRCYSVSQISVISANFSALQHNNRNHSVSKAPRISPFFPRTTCHRSISGSILLARLSLSLSLSYFPSNFSLWCQRLNSRLESSSLFLLFNPSPVACGVCV